jgi:uncharacterized protein (TIGR00369 family)
MRHAIAYAVRMNDIFDISKLVVGSAGHGKAIGLRYIGHGADWAELAIDYDPRLVTDVTTNVLASGAIISLIDSACGLAMIAKNGGIRPSATLDLRVDYMRAAKVGRTVTARGTCYRMTRSVAFLRCEAHDGDPDDLVAHANATFMFTSAA